MSGRSLFLLVFGVLALAWGLDSRRGLDLLRANADLYVVEQVAPQAAQAGAQGRPVLRRALELLDRAAAGAPFDSRIALARGSVLLLLERPHEAVAAYEAGIDIEPRPELYLNLGRARLLAGDAAGARESFAEAVRQMPSLGDAIPPEMR